MPFKPRLLSEPKPAEWPDVSIFFHGQLLLRSEDGISCEVGVNPLATNHVLSVDARTRIRRPGKVDLDLINMRHLGPLHFRRPEGMTITLTEDEEAPPPVAWSCRTFDAINYETGEGPPDEDFRWILNLEGPLFHRQDLLPPIFGANVATQTFGSQNVIKLQGGEYFFETALRVEGFDHVRDGGGQNPLTLSRIGAIARADVYLRPAQGLVMYWQDTTQEDDRVLTLTKAENTTYEIYIQNTPLFVDAPDPSNPPRHDELLEYYRSIPEIDPRDRFSLNPVPVTSPRPVQAGSPSIPCQVMVLDGPNT